MANNKGHRAIVRQTAQHLRLNIISHLYKRGYSYRRIREEVMARLDLQRYSLKTVHDDIHKLLAEWRAERIANMDLAAQLELERLDDIIREAWDAWDKSKQDYDHIRQRQLGRVNNDNQREGNGVGEIETVSVEKTTDGVNRCGDPRYLDIIQRALIERRKILGLYEVKKIQVSGNIGFEMSREEIEAEIARMRARI